MSGTASREWSAPLNLLDFDDTADRLLGRTLLRQSEQIPDDDFLVWDDLHFSFGRTNELANASASAFTELGVRAGDNVAFYLETCPDWVWLTLGLNKLGAVWVPTNTDYKGRWLAESLEDSRARVLVTDAALLPRIAELYAKGGDAGAPPFEHVVVRGDVDATGSGLEIPMTPIDELTRLPAGEPPSPGISYGDTAAILWTSGTTGRSKGVMQSHNVWVRAALDGTRSAGVRQGDVLYSCLPMYQSAAWVANIYQALVAGVPCAIDPRFSASEFWDRTRHYGATVTFTLGAMHMFLWNAPERADDSENPLRSAGMVPMPDDLVPRFLERFGMERIYQGYGQSEVMGMLQRRHGRTYEANSIGEAMGGLEVTLKGEQDLEIASGEVGELCVRPMEPYVIFNGYFRDPQATLRATTNLWYHTGDLGRKNEAGDYFFVDRKADYIRFKGRNISSFAVEAACSAHASVLLCAAHGVVSEQLSSEAELKVCVVLKPGAALSEEALARFVNDTAPYFFVPRYIELMDALPQTPTGRVQKYKLRERGVTEETWDAQAAGFVITR
jgi:crotonobetaine/carnitine-CoA ligase